MNDIDSLKIQILQKLIRGSVRGGKHTPLYFIKKGIPMNYRNTHKGQKIFEMVIQELSNATWITIVSKRTGRGSEEHISLNQKMIGEIYRYLEEKTKNETMKLM